MTGDAGGGPDGRGLDLVLVWHMHQPDYRDPATGEHRLPWAYLHAIKDYADMVWHLEQHPQMRAVVNFVPVLLDQIEDYARQFASGQLRDPLLRLLARPERECFTSAERAFVLDRCFHANHTKMIAPFPAYQQLHELAGTVEQQGGSAIGYLSDRYLFDLLTWYHLAWTGETVRRDSLLVGELMAAGRGFSERQRLALLDLLGRTLADIVPRCRRLEEAGRIEISTTPFDHPLAPLLIDFCCAREARPELPLPAAERYPGGGQRHAEQLRAAMDSHRRRFGRAASGVWPAEGAISDASAAEVGRLGVAWTASGEQVLKNSLRKAGRAVTDWATPAHRAYRLPDLAPGTTVFFRDERLSDLIGFEYKHWDSEHAAAHFVGELEAIAAQAAAGTRPVVSVILDGENPWEHYPYNGFYFLSALYRQLAGHPVIRPCTYREWLARQDAAAGTGEAAQVEPLPGLVAGSWVYGDLTTWIGSPDKNAAWDLLAAAKRAFDDALAGGALPPHEVSAATRLLSICESSDWFWWFGDYNPSPAVASFDRLFRDNLVRLYRALRLQPPASLDQPVSRGHATAEFEGPIRRAR